MFYGTAYIVDIAHKVMVATADEQLRLALKLLPRLSYSREDKAYRAAINLAGTRQSRWQRITRHLDHAADDCRWQALR
jgi:hypothetical protein